MNRTISQYVAILLLASMLHVTLHAESISNKVYGSAVVSEVTSIYDGDTFRANLKEYPEIIGYRIGVRINGIDTPEMRGQCQKEKDLARQAKELTVTQLRGAKKIELRNMKRGKYFRIVADVYVDGKSLGDMLIKRSLAVPYDGGHKGKDWCQ
ncbi:thermonuclease family protein [Sulfurimonas sp. HSL3-7]|uniref:thermonuclease family protein n=1 Tax=Sulfonitrofixus jiaomeiensis TaxID=3131938 RepID=UPI0031F9F1AF